MSRMIRAPWSHPLLTPKRYRSRHDPPRRRFSRPRRQLNTSTTPFRAPPESSACATKQRHGWWEWRRQHWLIPPEASRDPERDVGHGYHRAHPLGGSSGDKKGRSKSLSRDLGGFFRMTRDGNPNTTTTTTTTTTTIITGGSSSKEKGTTWCQGWLIDSQPFSFTWVTPLPVQIEEEIWHVGFLCTSLLSFFFSYHHLAFLRASSYWGGA